MLLALGDTHGTRTPRLSDQLRERIEAAEVVVHTGDFTTPAVLDAFAAAGNLEAVSGNSDDGRVRERLPETRTVEWADRRFVVAHGHRREWTSLSLLARQENADVVVVGHTHRPWAEQRGELGVVNPGSHADPRGREPSYALFERTEGGVVGRCRTVDGLSLGTVEL
jgi:putative phosphoesterase